MDPISKFAGAAGLVTTLESILRTLPSFTTTLPSTSLGTIDAAAQDPLRDLRQHSLNIQRNLHTDLKKAHLEKLLHSLQPIEHQLDKLQEVYRNVRIYRQIPMLRGFHWKHDSEDAVASILLARNVIYMMKALQGLGHRESMISGSVGSYNEPSIDYMDAALNPKHYRSFLEAPNTKAQAIFTRLVGPEGQEKFHEQCRAERIPGTCEWFLAREEFQTWLRHPSRIGDNAIFWCQGKPGIGKTILASKVIDRLQPSHIVAYFYMSSASPHSASEVVTSLLKQLCVPLHIVPDRLQQIFEQTNDESGYRLQLEDSLEALKEAIHSIQQPVTIIIDGLDETNVREQSDFIQVFNSLQGTSSKCLVTSRGNQSVLPNACDRFFEFFIENDANEKDIYNFLKGVLEENEPVDNMLTGDPELRLQLLDILTSRARGMFFWATLQLRHILEQTYLSGIRDALKSIPIHIGEIVNSALRMVKLQDENRVKLAYGTLALLTAAPVPLTAEAMCHALGLAHVLDYQKGPSKLDPEEIPNFESINECCMGLIKVDPVTRAVTLAHYDILREMREEWTEIFGRDQTARPAEICIAYLCLADFAGGPCDEIATLRERLEKYPFLDYASHYWGYHARKALLLPYCKAHVKNNIHRFLKQPINLTLSLQVSNYNPEGKQKPMDIDFDSFLGVSSLQIASRHGLVAIVKDLLSMDPDKISIPDRNGRTALHEAAQAGWEEIVSMLINAGADPSLIDDEGKTPFVYAAQGGHAGVISTLERHHVRGDHHQRVLEEALCDAAEAGTTSVVKKLLNLGVSANAEKSDVTAMAAASRRGHKQIIRLLLENEASVSYDDGLPNDSIPLHQAMRNGHVEIAATLVDYGASIQTRDRLNRTALFETLNTPDTRGAALLLKNGIDISCVDSMGNTVLHEAARRGSVELALRFVDRGVDVTMPNKEGLTPSHLAVQYGHPEVAALLLQEEATVHAHDATDMLSILNSSTDAVHSPSSRTFASAGSTHS